MARMLEPLFIRLFRIVEGFNLVNQNTIKKNFPAIDLADDAERVSVQVTSNATTQKIKETIETFKNHLLKGKYDKLFIVGFCDAKKTKCYPNVTVWDMDDIVNRLIDNGSEADVQKAIDAIRRHSDYSKLHPYEENACLEIILNCIDRNAIKHRMICEGSYDLMVAGLNEITELITTGGVGGWSKGRSLDNFQNQEIKSFLTKTKNLISDILVIVNSSRQHGFVYINHEGMAEIDRLKELVADEANRIAKLHGINISVSLRGNRSIV